MAAAAPFFSIIVPTYRRPAQFAVCLEAMPDPGDPVRRARRGRPTGGWRTMS